MVENFRPGADTWCNWWHALFASSFVSPALEFLLRDGNFSPSKKCRTRFLFWRCSKVSEGPR